MGADPQDGKSVGEGMSFNRREGLGGSDAAAALGLSPWKQPLELYLEKCGELPESAEENERMLWGKLLEPVIRQRYSELTGRTVRLSAGKAYPQTDITLRHERFPWMFAHPDGITDDGRLFEAKTTGSAEGWGEPGTDQVPQPYLIQVQHYLIVTKLPVADIAVLIGGQRYRQYEVPADRELQELILDGEQEFWQRIVDRRPPEPAFERADTIKLLRRLYPGTNGQRLVATQEQEEWRRVYAQASEQQALYQGVADGAKAHLLATMGEAALLAFSDGKSLRRKLIDKRGYSVAPTQYMDARFVADKEER